VQVTPAPSRSYGPRVRKRQQLQAQSQQHTPAQLLNPLMLTQKIPDTPPLQQKIRSSLPVNKSENACFT
jgi:hypothetical protein